MANPQECEAISFFPFRPKAAGVEFLKAAKPLISPLTSHMPFDKIPKKAVAA
jgi:hypothetical protein